MASFTPILTPLSLKKKKTPLALHMQKKQVRFQKFKTVIHRNDSSRSKIAIDNIQNNNFIPDL